MEPNYNILSQRYATFRINQIFSEKFKNILERKFWVSVLKAQKNVGMNVPMAVIADYMAVESDINLDRIKEIELETRHDVKAKIQAFNEAAGVKGEYIHGGMTSRGLTDNVEQIQIRDASQIILGKYVSVLRHMLDKAEQYKDIELTARTHHQAAQPTLLGKRFAMWAEELFPLILEFETFIEDYPLRGIKGAVGTQSDMLTLLSEVEDIKDLPEKEKKEAAKEKVIQLEKLVAKECSFKKTLSSIGQVYPRSLDYSLASKLAALTAACSNFALGMRLMSGYELVTEGFKEGQVGSSAMPHKMNTRSSERINGFANLIKMYADGASRISGDQWEEGDVSCSVQRRVIIPNLFYASDGLCETTLTVLNEMGPYPLTINNEFAKFIPFLATTQILMEAKQAGIPREQAHEVIRKHAVAEALSMRQYGKPPTLSQKLAQDPLFEKAGITKQRIDGILKDKERFIGRAHEQIDDMVEKTKPLIEKYSKEAEYEPGAIL